MPAFADYLDLRTAVLETVGRTDITDIFDRLTLLAEARFNRELRSEEQITSGSIEVVDGVGPLPADFREMIAVYGANGKEMIAQPVPPLRRWNWSYYAVSNGTLLASDAIYEVDYYGTIPTLTTSETTTNWLLSEYPDVYLYGVAAEAAKNKRDIEAVPILEGYRDAAITEARTDDNRKRYARARVRVQGSIQ